jgi:hypothetical protein
VELRSDEAASVSAAEHRPYSYSEADFPELKA